MPQPQLEPVWAAAPSDVLARVGSTTAGLRASEAATRQRAAPVSAGGPTAVRVLARQLVEPLVLVLLVAAGVSIAVGSSEDGVIILAIVALTAGFGFAQEYHAENAVRKLLERVRLTATVRRDGVPAQVPFDEVVVGDVVLLTCGAMLPGDGRLIEASGLQTDESSLTGESFPAEKQVEPVSAGVPPAGRRSAVFLGTHVVSGTGAAVVTAVGAGTELGHLAKRLGAPRPKTEFQQGLQRFGYLLMQVTGVLVLAVFAVNVAFDRPKLEAFLFATALAVGIVPELLPALVTIALSRGAARMSARGALVKHLPAIENLGAIDVLCSDKTGTLTEGSVRLEAAVDLDGAPSARVLDWAALNATFESGYANPLDEALRRGVPPSALRTAWPGDARGWTRVGEVAYDFVRKRLSVAVEREGQRWLITKGQLARVLDVCSDAELPSGAVVPIDEARPRVTAQHEALTAAGARVLGVAILALPPGDGSSPTLREVGMCFVGLLAFADPPRADAPEVLRDLGALGVSVKIVTGDDRRVAAQVWRTLYGRDADVVTGDALRGLIGPGLARRAAAADVFAEIEPQAKERIVQALRGAGHVVAYLGDGINDAAALHASDVGVSVEGAADVAREAADIVLQRRDLAVLAEGIREGRRTMARTLVYVRYTTSANFGNMLSMAVASVALPFLPLLPKQILLNNFLSDLPAVAITGDRVDEDGIARPGRWRVADVRRFMLVFGTVSSAFDLATFGALWWLCAGDPDAFRTGWFVESLLTEVVVLLVLRSRRPFWRSRPSPALLWLVIGVSAVAIACPYTPIAPLFGLEPLPLGVLAAVLGITGGYVAATEAAKRWAY